jgi:hypothetical protein
VILSWAAILPSGAADDSSWTMPQKAHVIVERSASASGSGLPQPSQRRAWTDIERV